MRIDYYEFSSVDNTGTMQLFIKDVLLMVCGCSTP